MAAAGNLSFEFIQERRHLFDEFCQFHSKVIVEPAGRHPEESQCPPGSERVAAFARQVPGAPKNNSIDRRPETIEH
jgi:hypothetical protein